VFLRGGGTVVAKKVYLTVYFCEFEKELKNILGCEFGDYIGSIRRKKPEVKISCYCPFKRYFLVLKAKK
jgi:hypothetical protein